MVGNDANTSSHRSVLSATVVMPSAPLLIAERREVIFRKPSSVDGWLLCSSPTYEKGRVLVSL